MKLPSTTKDYQDFCTNLHVSRILLPRQRCPWLLPFLRLHRTLSKYQFAFFLKWPLDVMRISSLGQDQEAMPKYAVWAHRRRNWNCSSFLRPCVKFNNVVEYLSVLEIPGGSLHFSKLMSLCTQAQFLRVRSVSPFVLLQIQQLFLFSHCQ